MSIAAAVSNTSQSVSARRNTAAGVGAANGKNSARLSPWRRRLGRDRRGSGSRCAAAARRRRLAAPLQARRRLRRRARTRRRRCGAAAWRGFGGFAGAAACSAARARVAGAVQPVGRLRAIARRAAASSAEPPAHRRRGFAFDRASHRRRSWCLRGRCARRPAGRRRSAPRRCRRCSTASIAPTAGGSVAWRRPDRSAAACRSSASACPCRARR